MTKKPEEDSSRIFRHYGDPMEMSRKDKNGLAIIAMNQPARQQREPSRDTQHEAQENETLEAYMRRKHESLGNSYGTEDGRYLDACSLIAFDIAFSLLEAGHEPVIASFRGREIRGGGVIRNESLRPCRYSGNIKFGGHTACLYNGHVYDPMVSVSLVPLEDYCRTAFLNSDIEVQPEALSTEYIRQRLLERKGS